LNQFPIRNKNGLMATDPVTRSGSESGNHRQTESSISLKPAPQNDLIAGKYRLLATLGHGGMADVYLGAASGPAGFNKLVVIKRLRNGGDDPALVQMFFDEARLAARLNHPNIVHTYEVDESPAGYVLVMEYLEGQPLRRFAKALRTQGAMFDPALAAYLVSEVLAGLHYVHEMRDYDGTPLDVVHRDVSPQNLFITYDGHVKVLDFGIAKGSLNLSDTQSGVLKGKVSYMAPEQASEESVDRRADIFAAGVVLWELLTGEKPFKGDAITTLRSLAQTRIEPPSSFAPGISPELDAIVLKAMARSPHARFGSALAMRDALSGWLLHERHAIRREDVALLMQQHFAGAREAMAKRVQEFMVSHTSDAPVSSGDTIAPPSVVSTTKKEKHFFPFVLGSFAVGVAVAAGLVIGRSNSLREDPHAANVANQLSVANRAEADPTFHLTLSSDPPEAVVEWGGSVVGQTPMLIDLAPGPQTFLLSREGYLKATVILNITDAMAGRNESRTVVMVPRAKGRAVGSPPLVARPAIPSKGGASVPLATVATPAPGAFPQPMNTPPPEAIEGTVAAPTSAALATVPALPAAAAPAPAPAAAKAAPAPVDEPSLQPVAAAPAPAPGVAPAVLPFGPEMTRPVLLSGAELVPTREALVAGVSGTMIAKCTISVDGSLRNCRILKGLPHLDKAMLDMLATRRYSPVLYQGKPVSVEYVFNLKVAPPVR
jgi:serine/threonine protein kinase